MNRNYQDVNKIEEKFFGKNSVEADNRGNRTTLKILNTERDVLQPLLGLDWLREFKWAIENIEHAMKKTKQSDKNKIKESLETFFKSNRKLNLAERR